MNAKKKTIIAFMLGSIIITLLLYINNDADNRIEIIRKFFNYEKNMAFPYSSFVLKEENGKGKEAYFLSKLETTKACEWNISIGENVDTSKLPLDGYTIEELIEYAENNKSSDAFLLLARSKTSPFFEGTKRTKLGNKKKWIEKSVRVAQQKGSVFLLSYIEYIENNVLYKGIDSIANRKGVFVKLQGYHDFSEALKQGNSSLLFTLLDIDPELKDDKNCEYLIEYVRNSLAEKIDKNNPSTLREYANFEFHVANLTELENEIDEQRPQYIIYLSDLLKNWITIRKHKGTSEIGERLVYASLLLKEAAKCGDIEAKKLWLLYGGIGDHYSLGDWKDVFNFTDDLLKIGDASFMNMLCSEYNRIPSSDFIYIPISGIWCLYSEESSKKIIKNCRNSLYKRGDYFVMEYDMVRLVENENEISGKEKLEKLEYENSSLLKNIYEKLPVNLLIQSDILDALLEKAPSEEIKEKILNIVNQEMENGNVRASLALAHFLMKKNDIESLRKAELILNNTLNNNFCSDEEENFIKDGRLIKSSEKKMILDGLIFLRSKK